VGGRGAVSSRPRAALGSAAAVAGLGPDVRRARDAGPI